MLQAARDQFAGNIKNRVPMKRFGTPEEVRPVGAEKTEGMLLYENS